MKRDIRELLRKLQLLLVGALALYPVYWLAAAWLGGEIVGISWIFAVAGVLFASVALFVPGKLRVAYALCVCAGVFAAVILRIPDAFRFAGLVLAGLFSLQLFLCLQIAHWDRTGEIPGPVLAFGIGAHAFGQVILLMQWTDAYPGWMLRLSLYGFVLFAMLSVNRRTLVTAYGKWGTVPLSMGRRNALLVVGLFLFSLLGGLIPSGAGVLRNWILQGIRWLGSKIAALLSRANGGASGGADENVMTMAPGAGGDPLVLPPLLEKIALIVGALLSVCLIAFMLWRLIKGLAAALREGLGILGKFFSGASEDYVDEVSDTRDTADAQRLKSRRRVPRRYREDPGLPPDEQIRSRFRYLKYRHPEWKPGATAREKLPEDAASIYEQTRYSDRVPTSEDALRFKESLRNM